jgi:hypothetical protein
MTCFIIVIVRITIRILGCTRSPNAYSSFSVLEAQDDVGSIGVSATKGLPMYTTKSSQRVLANVPSDADPLASQR